MDRAPSGDIRPLVDRLRGHVDVLAEQIGERNTRHPAALEGARAYLKGQLGAMGCVVGEQVFQTHARAAVNLEVILPGSRAAWPTLVVGAHYDSAPGTPGADDNASAVAILLEITRELVRRRRRRTVRVVFYDCEEPPHFATEMGSQHHARELRRGGEELDGMICLESLGYFATGGEGPAQIPRSLRWLTGLLGERYVAIVCNPASKRFGLKFVTRFATSGFFPFVPAALSPGQVPAIGLSDHRSYWEQDYRALMVTDTAFLRNPHYHRPTDRLETLDLPRMSRLCGQLTRAVRRMCV